LDAKLVQKPRADFVYIAPCFTSMAPMEISLCLLTVNSACTASLFLKALNSSSFHDIDRLLVDSTSDDGTSGLFAAAGFRVHQIPRSEFNHGGTRQLAANLCPDAEIIIFMTQDAMLANPHSLKNLVSAFSDSRIGAAFGRQRPKCGANPIESHARLFNYPAESQIKSAEDIPTLGIKTAFISNSFAAYRVEALRAVGGFPQRTIIGEDTYVAGKILLSGWKVAYCAEAQVFHSHDYSFRQEWQRYFDTGVFHSRNLWLRESFGAAEGEGFRFLKSEIRYVVRHDPWLIFSVLMRIPLRYLGFRTGLLERYIPLSIKRLMSAQKGFWKNEVA